MQHRFAGTTRKKGIQFYTRLLVLAAVALCLSCAYKATSGHFDTAKSAETQTALEEYIERAERLGFSGVAYFRKDSALLLNSSAGWSDEKANAKNQTDTPFYCASLAKSFTAAAILKLEDDRILNTSDPMHLYLEEVPIEKRTISIHHLLTHSSGIGSFGWNGERADWNIMSRDDAVDGILNTPLNAKPGTKFNYANANYILLAAIVEHVSGSAFHNYVQDKLLDSLEMNHTYFGLQLKNQLIELPVNFVGSQSNGRYTDYPQSWLRVGGGDLISTAEDLDKWVRGLYVENVLSEVSKRKMFSIQLELGENFGYGFGWYVRTFSDANKRVIFHTGGFKGYSAEVRFYPESATSIVVLSNSDAVANVSEIISNDLLAVYRGNEIPLPDVKKMPKKINRLNGVYRVDSTSSLEVETNVRPDGTKNLIVKAHGQQAIELFQPNKSRHSEEMRALNRITEITLHKLSIHPETAFQSILVDEEMQYLGEYVAEWSAFINNAEVKGSVNHTVFLGGDIYRTYVTLRNPHVDRYFAFTWKNRKLIGTAPGEQFRTPAIRLHFSKNLDFNSYDWEARESIIWSFAKSNGRGAWMLNVNANGASSLAIREAN